MTALTVSEVIAQDTGENTLFALLGYSIGVIFDRALNYAFRIEEEVSGKITR